MAVTRIALHSLFHLHPSSLIHNLQARRSGPSSPFPSHMGSTLLSMSGHGLPSMSHRAGTYWKPSGRGLRQCRQSSSSTTVQTHSALRTVSPLSHTSLLHNRAHLIIALLPSHAPARLTQHQSPPQLRWALVRGILQYWSAVSSEASSCSRLQCMLRIAS